MEVKVTDKNLVVELIRNNHYSGQLPSITKHWLGVFIGGNLVGVITLGYGTRPLDTAKKILPTFESKDYLEIGKMCMDDTKLNSLGIPTQNLESQMLSVVIKWIKKELPHVKALYTMADGMMGKVGYCYQAANFIYIGKYWTDLLVDDEGNRVHPRSEKARLMLTANDDWLIANGDSRYKKINWKHRIWPTLDYLNLIGWKWYRGENYRYVYPLNKATRKAINKHHSLLNNPKGDSLRWKLKVAHRQSIEVLQPPIIA